MIKQNLQYSLQTPHKEQDHFILTSEFCSEITNHERNVLGHLCLVHSVQNVGVDK